MSERAHYSRVYWSIVDDPKFVDVYDDDRHLAAWLRCLIVADQAYPESAHVPAGCSRASIRVLASVGLLDVQGSRFRVHGLDAERGRRAAAATHSGPKRDPDGALGRGLGRGRGREAEQGLSLMDGGRDAWPPAEPV